MDSQYNETSCQLIVFALTLRDVTDDIFLQITWGTSIVYKMFNSIKYHYFHVYCIFL